MAGYILLNFNGLFMRPARAFHDPLLMLARGLTPSMLAAEKGQHDDCMVEYRVGVVAVCLGVCESGR